MLLNMLTKLSSATKPQSYQQPSFTNINIRAPMRENLSSGFASNNGTDQPAHQRRLISAFVIHFLESVISKRDTGEISVF